MNIEGWECKGCGRPVFYDWVTHTGTDNDNYYWHVSCHHLELRKNEEAFEPSITRQLSLFGEEATS
jgi:hypothetical protein